LATFTFAIPFSAKKQACGPEARALRGKSIGGKRKRLEDPPLLPQNEAGPSGVREFGMWNSEFFASLFPIPHSAIGIPHFNCPPGPRNEVCLMVFARNALASGPGNA
jgi:hypothetical protein